MCVCVWSLSVMSRMRNVAVRFFTHAAGSSISGNISHSASLTPSALLQYPHIFFIFSVLPPLFTLPSPFHPLPLTHIHTHFSLPLSPAPPCLISAFPSPSLTPPFILTQLSSFLFSTHCSLWFSCHRTITPASLRRVCGRPIGPSSPGSWSR